MRKEAKIYIAGHGGMVGSALTRRLLADGYSNIVRRTHSELDLTRQADVEAFFAGEKPEYVFLAAAKAGGVHANSTYPADFIFENLAIELNVISAAAKSGVKKLLFIGSTSVYPKNAPQPISEASLLTGELEPSNAAYGLAKIVGLKLCEYCNRQYGTEFISVMPTNLYGYGDKYDLQNAHVLPALIRKFSEAVDGGADKVEIWGSGAARREFLHADDLADACLFLMERYNEAQPVNVGAGTDLTIRELAELLKSVSGFTGELFFDKSKPEGIMRRLTDCSKLFSMGWKPKINFEKGVTMVYNDYRTEQN
ncbi:MAG: GDP-L-fucose synthase, partial [Oscillospiraceae bacterium]|nr:GDP-L-fucose synthase [Oscillospiraceae bacterium]